MLGATRCAPEFTFEERGPGTGQSGGSTGTPDAPELEGGLGSGEQNPATDHCENERQDRDLGELDVDCGGPDCEPCPIQCPQGAAECDGVLDVLCETRLLIDAQHCGDCANRCELAGASAVSCSSGECLVETCTAPFANCNARSEDGCEVNLSVDPMNCGACGTVCPSLHGKPSCRGSTCQIESCETGWADCNQNPADGCERPTSSDTSNCGACGKVCPSSSTETAFCKDGECGATNCEAGLGDCDGDGVCESNLDEDPTNCGSCGNPCGVANGVGKCVEGECVVDRCDSGFANCDEEEPDNGFSTGCETNTRESQAHCGECGKPCQIENAIADCSNGVCQVSSCVPPFGDCDGDGTSCETDTSDNTSHCGSCGNNCRDNFAPGNANGVCEDSQCVFDGCRTGFLDCNEDELTCEANPRTDGRHCGACGVLCATGPGTSSNTCVNALCQPTCRAGSGYADCDTDRANGCESNTQTSTQHCGGCGVSCSMQGAASTRCTAGECRPTCSGGRGNCDNNGQNGCEVNLNTDPDHCGGCNLACSEAGTTSTSCQTSGASPATPRCVPICDATHANCDGDGFNGCEIDLTNDPNHCGSCDVACSTAGTSSTRCMSGKCSITCDASHGDCDEDIDNGCEAELNTSENCGTCGTRCASGELCVAGECEKTPRIGILSSVSGGAAGSVLNLNLNLVAGSNRLLLVAVVGRGLSNGPLAQATPDSVTYGGRSLQALTQFGPPGEPVSEGNAYVFYYYLKEAELAALGSGTKSLAISGNVTPPSPNALAADAILFSGVNQPTPLSNAFGKTGASSGGNCAPGNTVTLAKAGSVIYAIGAAQFSPIGSPNPVSLTRTLNYSYRGNGGQAAMWVGAFHHGVNTDAELAEGSYPVGFTFSYCGPWVFSTVVVNRP